MRVLVVDNDSDTRDVLQMVLEDAGYAVTVASSGRAAQEVLWQSCEPMVVLVDQSMPQMTGTQLLQTVMGDGHCATQTYIVLTASPDRLPAPFNLAAMQIVVPVLAKPFNLDALLDAVSTASGKLRC